MLWPTLGTAGSVSSEWSGAIARSVIGGRFLTPAVGPLASPREPRSEWVRWANGRYQTSVGDTESDRPTSAALWAKSDEVSAPIATSGAVRRRSTRAGMPSGSSTTLTWGAAGSSRASQSVAANPASSVKPDGSSRWGAAGVSTGATDPSRPFPAGLPVSSPSPAPSFRAREKNSSSVRIRIAASRSGSFKVRSASSSATGTSRLMVTSSRDRRALSA